MSEFSTNPNYIEARKAIVPEPGNLMKVIIDFETVNGEPYLQSYDAQPKNPAVHDTTIGYGFNLNRPDARSTFQKLVPGLDFDKVKEGQQNITKQQAWTLLNHDIEERVALAQLRLGTDLYNSFPANVKSAIISAIYRGDLGPKTMNLIKDQKWKDVSVEYLNHKQYKDADKLGIIGIRTRMNWNAEQFNTMIKH